MKKRHTIFYHISVFVIAQLLWLMVLGLWIYWYVTNYIILKEAGGQLAPQIQYKGTNVLVLVGGIVLLVAISFAMSVIFRNLNVQLRLTRLYDNFIANITHELKSPLASIQLYLETLNARNVPPEKQKEFLEIMMQDADRLKNLINSILQLSAIEQSKKVFEYDIYDTDFVMRKLLYESIDQFKLPKEIIKIESDVKCKCALDINAFKIVINNLIDNAVKYSTGNPEIQVRITNNSKKLYIEIKDNGVGIPLPEQKKVFSKFYRIADKNIPNVKGTGLGLYQVKEIIKKHGGKISAVSEGSGKGSIFKIELPVPGNSKIKLPAKLRSDLTEEENYEERSDG